jgi:SARP family transcriptional regulator, regulator of embCAB operon
MIRFKVLGTLRVTNGDRDCTPTPPKMRSVLALLLLSANRVVQIDSIIEELWGDSSPRSAITTVQTYIYHLRRLFAAERCDPPGGQLLLTKQGGYLFEIDPDQVDAQVFGCLVQQGRKQLEENRPEAATAILEKALAMWTGPALADVSTGNLLQAQAIHLEERRINALEFRIEADIRLGRERELIAELRSLVCSHPLNEWFHGQLIQVLGNSGRRSEALHAYQSLRSILREELGVDPSPELQRIQHGLLSAGAGARRGWNPSDAGAHLAAAPAGSGPVPDTFRLMVR